MMNETVDSDHGNQNQLADDKASPRLSLDKDALKKRAGKTWRGVWQVGVVLATIGGIIGLFQTMTKEQQTLLQGSEPLLIALVAEGVITDVQAGNLAKVLSGASYEFGAEGSATVNAALKDEDKDALIAMARMFDENTREEGLDGLEVAATTAGDWLLVAQLSVGSDNMRGLKAAEKSVQLDRENFRALTLLVQMQAAAGQYDRARRSVESARILARTPTERLLAEQTALSVSTIGFNKDQMKKDLKGLQTAIDGYQSIIDLADFEEPLTKVNIDKHPFWTLAFIKQIKADAESSLERNEQARTTAQESIALFETLESHADAESAPVVRGRVISMFRTIANTYHGEENHSDAKQYEKKIVEHYENLVEAGAPRAPILLASSLVSLGHTAYKEEDWDEAIELYERALEILKKLELKKPESKSLSTNIKSVSDYIESTRAIRDNSGNEVEAFKTSFEESGRKLIKSPQDRDLRENFIDRMHRVFGALSKDYKKNSDELLVTANYAKNIVTKIEQHIGPNYFGYEILFYAVHFQGAAAEEQGDLKLAKESFRELLIIADLIAGAPDADEFDAEKEGINLESYKISAWLTLASLDDEDSLSAAKSGLRLAEARDAAGQLPTRSQYLIQQFKDRIKELGSED